MRLGQRVQPECDGNSTLELEYIPEIQELLIQDRTMMELTTGRREDDVAEKMKGNLIYYLGIPKPGAPLMVVLMCFGQGVGTYI